MPMNVDAAPFVPKAFNPNVPEFRPNASALNPSPFHPPGYNPGPYASAGFNPMVRASQGDAGNQPPLFYDNGQMIRPHHQPHFFGVAGAPLLPPVQVGRVGTSATASLLHNFTSAERRDVSAASAGNGSVPVTNTVTQSVPQRPGSIDTTGLCLSTFVPRQTEELSILQTMARLQRPLIVLVLGGRGSGKTTQSMRIAAKYGLLRLCSGDIVRNGQVPLVVLEDVLTFIQHRKASGPSLVTAAVSQDGATPPASSSAVSAAESDSNAQEKYHGALRGIVLDRFIGNAEADPYFLLYLLHKYGLQLDLTINLMMDYDTAVARAETRDEAEAAEHGAAAKPKKDQRRFMEHLTVWETCNVLQAYGGLECIEVDGLDQDQVEYEIQVRVDRTIVGLKAGATGARRRLPELPSLCPGVVMSPSVADYLNAREAVHIPLETPANKRGVAPFSLMTGLVDLATMTALKKHLSSYHVSWKADGQRALVVRHKNLGFIVFTSKFTSFYVIDSKLIPKIWLSIDSIQLAESQVPLIQRKAPESDVTHIFDAELVDVNPSVGKYRLYIFDLIYAGPQQIRGYHHEWKVRYEALQRLCLGLSVDNAWSFVLLKDFVPCSSVRSLVQSGALFPTDGIIFQHKGVYKVPYDARLYKWKPQTQCSVDFRLSGALSDTERRRWLFHPLVLRYENKVADEIVFKNAIIAVSDIVVEKQKLADGMIVECVKTNITLSYENIVHEVWEFVRTRVDKLYPNDEEIAKKIDSMEHLDVQQVVALCEAACGSAVQPSSSRITPQKVTALPTTRKSDDPPAPPTSLASTKSWIEQASSSVGQQPMVSPPLQQAALTATTRTSAWSRGAPQSTTTRQGRATLNSN